MPPKHKFSKEQIIQAAFTLVRQKGWTELSTRTLAKELGASARPIYSYFSTMEELEEEIVKKGVDLLYDHMIRERTGDPWLDHGIGYVMFAQAEKELFRAINDSRHFMHYRKYGEIIWRTLTDSLSGYPPFQGLTDEQIYQIQAIRWLMAQGLAFEVSKPPPGMWNNEKIARVIVSGSNAILDGMRRQFSG